MTNTPPPQKPAAWRMSDTMKAGMAPDRYLAGSGQGLLRNPNFNMYAHRRTAHNTLAGIDWRDACIAVQQM